MVKALKPGTSSFWNVRKKISGKYEINVFFQKNNILPEHPWKHWPKLEKVSQASLHDQELLLDQWESWLKQLAPMLYTLGGSW